MQTACSCVNLLLASKQKKVLHFQIWAVIKTYYRMWIIWSIPKQRHFRLMTSVPDPKLWWWKSSHGASSPTNRRLILVDTKKGFDYNIALQHVINQIHSLSFVGTLNTSQHTLSEMFDQPNESNKTSSTRAGRKNQPHTTLLLFNPINTYCAIFFRSGSHTSAGQARRAKLPTSPPCPCEANYDWRVMIKFRVGVIMLSNMFISR